MNWPARDRWIALWHALGATKEPTEWYDRLSTAYAQSHRHYHNQQHISECLVEFDQARHLARQPELVELALWFHDAVYKPTAADNEEQSAMLARQCLAQSGLGGALSDIVANHVLATKTHETGADPDAKLMVDVDLSILGQDEHRFLQYEQQIRQEYAWVPQFIFASKRAKILSRFVAREHIFATEWFRNKYERQARRNLETSIERLTRAG